MSASNDANRASTAPSLAGLPVDAAGRDVLAAEYALGTLDTRTVQRVVVAMQADPAWRDAVREWEARLGPLAMLARPESPPGNVWDRIDARLNPPDAPRVRRINRWAWIWRGWAIGASLAAAGIAAFAFIPRTQPPRMMTVMVNDRNLPGVLAEVDRRGDIRLNALPAATGRQLQAPAGKSLHIWALAPGAQAPTSLGLLPNEPGKSLTIPATTVKPVPNMLIEISVEPEGGSTTGRPTGPIIFIGRLTLAGPDT